MSIIRKVAVIGASGNFGCPITHALIIAGFDVTIISRAESTASFPAGIPVRRVDYNNLEELTGALGQQDAAVCVMGPAGVNAGHPTTLADAAEAAGVRRFIINDFGWGPNIRGLPEFQPVHDLRRSHWDHAKAKAEVNPAFTWTGITTGNPIDWALKKFPVMGFDIAQSTATIYDKGQEHFTGTTLEGIGQSVVGILQNPQKTENRFVNVLSIRTCQNELLQAFQEVTGKTWQVRGSTTEALIERGREVKEGRVPNHQTTGWAAYLVVAQLYDEGEARCVVAPSYEESDSPLLGVVAETPEQIVSKALGLHQLF